MPPTINYASKFESVIDERFKIGALTTPAVNQNFNWNGVKTISVYSVPTSPMNDYVRSGANRYGTPEELDNSIQEMTITQDKAFTHTIDRMNFNETMMANSAGNSLSWQLDERVIPNMDKYRLATICANAGTTVTGTIDKTNAYEAFLEASATLTDNLCPTGGRIAFVSPGFYKWIHLDDAFIKKGDMSQQMTIRGVIGVVDDITLILTPTSYLPAGVNFVITHNITTTAPTRLADYRIHEDPPGINGWLVEGRCVYDCFVLNNKKNAIYVHTA